jgi:hypothetical protein
VCALVPVLYKLSFRDLVDMMAERGLHLSHTTIMRWVQRYAPEFEKRWTRFARKVGRSLRVDETRESARSMDVPLSRGRPGWQYRRLPTKSGKRRGSGQGVLPQGASHPKVRTSQHHLGWLPCITPSCARDADGRRSMKSHQVEIIEIPLGGLVLTMKRSPKSTLAWKCANAKRWICCSAIARRG